MNQPFPPVVFVLMVIPALAAATAAVFLTMAGEPLEARYAAVIVLSYLLGSIPWGYILLRWRLGLDIREYGSGRIGMSNVLRTAGGRVAALVLVLDLGKGILAVVLAREVIEAAPAEVAAGLLVLVGHNWPIFLQFRGGRGIATGLGGLAVMAPIAAGLGALAFIPVTLITRYLSLGSVTAVVIACLAALGLSLAGIYPNTYTLYAFLGGAIIIWQHRDNIRRLRQGNERRLGHPARKLD